ncbi:MAG: DUF192 domain-containing protein [Myxococcota bacterium]|nr:DUF192 domain-containing protein [Myxococcota bacterium]
MLARCTLLLLLFTGSGCHNTLTAAPPPTAPPAVDFNTPTGTITVSVDLAQTPEQRRVGLMHRKALPQNHGMAFIFPTEAVQTFWMKDTPLFLDMVFINSQQKIVGIIHNAEPGTLNPRQIKAPSRYVVEVQGGFCERYGIQTGGVVVFRNFPKKVQH